MSDCIGAWIAGVIAVLGYAGLAALTPAEYLCPRSLRGRPCRSSASSWVAGLAAGPGLIRATLGSVLSGFALAPRYESCYARR